MGVNSKTMFIPRSVVALALILAGTLGVGATYVGVTNYAQHNSRDQTTRIASADTGQPLDIGEATTSDTSNAPVVTGGGEREDPDASQADETSSLQESGDTNRTGEYSTSLNFNPPFDNSPVGVICAWCYYAHNGEAETAYSYWATSDIYAKIASTGLASLSLADITASAISVDLEAVSKLNCDVIAKSDSAEVRLYIQAPGGPRQCRQDFTVRKLNGQWKIATVYVG